MHGPVLSPQLLLAAYAQGLFPMGERRDDPTLYWVSPEQRGVLPLDAFHVPRRLARTVRAGQFLVTSDVAFLSVMEHCAAPAPGREQSWINGEILRLYGALHAVGQLHASGVDELAAGVMQFPGGVAASFTCGMNAQADNGASICGDEGYIDIPVPWKPPEKGATWSLAYSTPPKMDQGKGAAVAARPKESFSVDAGKALYALEADDFAEAVLDGKPLRVSREDTLGNMQALDTLRTMIGVSWKG